jgi:hypothetical protein
VLDRAIVRTIAVGVVAALVLTGPQAAFAGTALTPYVPAVESTPVPPQQFDFATGFPYWTAIGIKPPVGADDDLKVLDSADGPLAGSSLPGDQVDAVAVNTNVRPPGTYHAQVSRFAGTGSYTVELAQGDDVLIARLPPAKQTVAMHGGFLAVRDLHTYQNHVYVIDISAPTAGVAAYVLPSGASTGNLATAAASCRSAGAETSCELIYTADRDGWAGVVLVSLGSTDLTATASQASPSPGPGPGPAPVTVKG